MLVTNNALPRKTFHRQKRRRMYGSIHKLFLSEEAIRRRKCVAEVSEFLKKQALSSEERRWWLQEMKRFLEVDDAQQIISKGFFTLTAY